MPNSTPSGSATPTPARATTPTNPQASPPRRLARQPTVTLAPPKPPAPQASTSAAPAPTSFPPYNVDDLRGDHGVSKDFDIYAQYSSARYATRKDLYEGLEPSSRDLLRKEIRRIRYFRDHFGSYRVNPTDRLPLVSLLEDARKKWREIAFRRAPDELNRLEKDIERNGDSPLRTRTRTILRYVSRWQSKEYGDFQKTQQPDVYMPDLDSKAGLDQSEDKPREPNYGYNGWIIVWDEEKGGVDMTHPLVHGSFPHQKISIQHLLYNKTDTPLKRTTKTNQYRYFHLPANSMQWVEDAMSRYYNEDNVEFDSKRVLSIKSNAQRLLRNETWRGQQRGGNNLPAHSRQIAPRCWVTPSAPVSGPFGTSSSRNRRDFSLFMPYLHWEIEKRLHRMGQFVEVAKSRRDHIERLRRASTSRYKGRIVDLSRIHASDPSRPVTGFEEDGDNPLSSSTFRPHRPLARYIYLVAKVYQIIDEAADGRLIEDHLFESSPLHMRRTLEQFHYWTADDTAHRDRDQVACKATRAVTDDPDSTARLVMVDQLWLWILDDNTVISSFPRRWGRNKPDPSAVHRGIRDRLGALDNYQISSVYDLAFIVIDECSKVFFDLAKPMDQRPEVIDIFSSAISSIADKKTIAYEGFGNAVSQSLSSLETVEHLLRRSLNIGFEWSILVEAQQVIDELQVMQEIFNQQASVMKDLERHLKSMPRTVKAKHGGPVVDALDADRESSKKFKQARILEGVSSLVSDMEQRRDELASMEKLQTKTRSQLRELLDMKQQQSNVIEAKAAIQRADESVLQGRSIVVFTVVTIFFLPLSFMTSVFGMNAKEISNDGELPLHDMLVWMFGISAAVIIVSLALAFSTWTRTALSVGASLAYATVEDWLGWRNKKSAYNSTALKRKQMAKFQELEQMAMTRRLTEINRRTMSTTLPPRGALNKMNSGNSVWKVANLTNGNLANIFRARQPGKSESV